MRKSAFKRLDDLEVKVKTMTGSHEPTVYGVIDRVDNIDGVLVPNIIRRWEGKIGSMVPTDKDPTVLLAEKLEPFILKYKKYKCLYGGRGGMKTRFAQNLFATQVYSSGCKVYALRERMTSLKESIYSGIETTIKRNNTPGYLSVPSKWEIRNNISMGKFVFGGMQNILDMKGTSDFKYFLMEEAEKTKQETIDTLGPTLRDVEGAELWYLWNTASSQDPMSKEFITPYQAALDKNGVYEDDYHLIIKLTYKDNPWFEHDESLRGEIEKDKQKVENKIMSQSRFNGIWNGDFNDDCATSVIKEDWFEACIDAHKKLGFEAVGSRHVGGDPSDTGQDPFGYAARHGVVFTDVDEIQGEDGNRKMDEACKRAIHYGCDSFGYDADGLGATLRDNVAAAFNGKQTNVYAYKGSTSPHNPESDFKSKVSSIQSSDKTVKNKDALKNKKAQNTMLLADRVYRTYDAVVNGKYHDPETLVSFASYDEETGIGIKPDMLRKLKAEASKIPIKEGNTIQFYTKPEMRRGITLPGGGKMVIPSPNLLDAVIVSLDKDCHIYKQEPIDIASLMVPVANSW